MGLSALSAGLSGLYANQKALDVEGHNVANINTAGFAAQRASFNETAPAGTGVTLSVAGRNLSAASGELDLPASIVNSLTYKAGFDLSAKVIKMADERIGTLLDITA